MNIWGAMQSRHAVRQYTNRKITGQVLEQLQQEIADCNRESTLNIQLVLEEPKAIGGLIPRLLLGFKGATNYIALVGADHPELEELAGYFGQRIVLKAQMLGLNTCWIAGTYARSKCPVAIKPGQRLVCIIAVGYGQGYGTPHKSKDMMELCSIDVRMPDWFRQGMMAAMLAPTAMGAQKFRVHLNKGHVHFEATGGAMSHIDLGIVQYQFEQGVGKDTFLWID